MSEQATKDHILESTITAIEKHGLPGLTTRLIAAEAGVNNAALHYHFGTKEALVEKALAMTLDHMLADTEEILGRKASVEDRLRALLGYQIEGTFTFPNIIRAHLWGPLMGGSNDGPFERMQEAWAERIWREIRREFPSASETAVRLALHTTLGGVVFLALMPPGKPSGGSLAIRNKQARERYIEQLIEFVLAGGRRRTATGRQTGTTGKKRTRGRTRQRS
jgi:AcrR family transcriptional regulator